MHNLLILLYCCASTTLQPTPSATHILFVRMVEIILGVGVVDRAALEYDPDPLVMVARLHNSIEPLTFNMDDVVSRFGPNGDVASTVWGPPAWSLLHQLARGPSHRLVRPLLKVWTEVLPCVVCRVHLEEHLRVTPNFGTTQQQTYTYTVALHNAVNVSLGKRCTSLSW